VHWDAAWEYCTGSLPENTAQTLCMTGSRRVHDLGWTGVSGASDLGQPGLQRRIAVSRQALPARGQIAVLKDQTVALDVAVHKIE